MRQNETEKFTFEINKNIELILNNEIILNIF